MSTITARYEGEGAFQDHDSASDHPGALIPSGGTFGTTKTRLKALQDQGYAVVEVSDSAPSASPPVADLPKMIPAPPAGKEQI